jgi:hypothetical protein
MISSRSTVETVKSGGSGRLSKREAKRVGSSSLRRWS